MNGTNFLIDTNIIIYLAQEKLKMDDFSKDTDGFYLSSIVYMEALGFLFQDPDEENKIIQLCSVFKHLYLTEEIEEQTIIIRKFNKIKLADAIIAATAIVYNLTLVTHDCNDFKNIPKLKILNVCPQFQY